MTPIEIINENQCLIYYPLVNYAMKFFFTLTFLDVFHLYKDNFITFVVVVMVIPFYINTDIDNIMIMIT